MRDAQCIQQPEEPPRIAHRGRRFGARCRSTAAAAGADTPRRISGSSPLPAMKPSKRGSRAARSSASKRRVRSIASPSPPISNHSERMLARIAVAEEIERDRRPARRAPPTAPASAPTAPRPRRTALARDDAGRGRCISRGRRRSRGLRRTLRESRDTPACRRCASCTNSRCSTWYLTLPIASAPMPTASARAAPASGLPSSITSTPAMPSGGTALTSAATSRCFACARSAAVIDLDARERASRTPRRRARAPCAVRSGVVVAERP